MTVETLSPGERPQLRRQSTSGWPALIESQVHPVKVAVIEVLRWVGGPLSAREVWLMGVGEPDYGIVAYHVRILVELGVLTHIANAPARGSVEKFHVLTPAA